MRKAGRCIYFVCGIFFIIISCAISIRDAEFYDDDDIFLGIDAGEIEMSLAYEAIRVSIVELTFPRGDCKNRYLIKSDIGVKDLSLIKINSHQVATVTIVLFDKKLTLKLGFAVTIDSH